MGSTSETRENIFLVEKLFDLLKSPKLLLMNLGFLEETGGSLSSQLSGWDSSRSDKKSTT